MINETVVSKTKVKIETEIKKQYADYLIVTKVILRRVEEHIALSKKYYDEKDLFYFSYHTLCNCL